MVTPTRILATSVFYNPASRVGGHGGGRLAVLGTAAGDGPQNDQQHEYPDNRFAVLCIHHFFLSCPDESTVVWSSFRASRSGATPRTPVSPVDCDPTSPKHHRLRHVGGDGR